MITPLAKLLDWLAIQLVWGSRVKSLLKLQSPAPSQKLEEALQFLRGPDFIPVESPPARLEFKPARSGLHFQFPTPRPGEFEENNVVYGRLYRYAERWQKGRKSDFGDLLPFPRTSCREESLLSPSPLLHKCMEERKRNKT